MPPRLERSSGGTVKETVVESRRQMPSLPIEALKSASPTAASICRASASLSRPPDSPANVFTSASKRPTSRRPSTLVVCEPPICWRPSSSRSLTQSSGVTLASANVVGPSSPLSSLRRSCLQDASPTSNGSPS